MALLDDLHRAGLLRSPGFPLPDDGILIGLKKRATDRMPPSIDFSECSETDTERQLTIHWLVSERSLAADLEAMICRHGGSLKKH